MKLRHAAARALRGLVYWRAAWKYSGEHTLLPASAPFFVRNMIMASVEPHV